MLSRQSPEVVRQRPVRSVAVLSPSVLLRIGRLLVTQQPFGSKVAAEAISSEEVNERLERASE